MEFRINKTEFLRGLRFAQSIADRKSTMPMLANVLLRTHGKSQLQIAATDLNVSLTAELKSTNLSEGAFTVGAKNLYEIISSAPGDEVTLRKADNHWAEIRSAKVSYRIVGMADRDFPKVPEHSDANFVEVEAGILREMIERTLFSVCNDETRFHLNGVLYEADGEISRMVSTDGHRMSKVERRLASPKLTSGVIIPKRACSKCAACWRAARPASSRSRPRICTCCRARSHWQSSSSTRSSRRTSRSCPRIPNARSPSTASASSMRCGAPN